MRKLAQHSIPSSFFIIFVFYSNRFLLNDHQNTETIMLLAIIALMGLIAIWADSHFWLRHKTQFPPTMRWIGVLLLAINNALLPIILIVGLSIDDNDLWFTRFAMGLNWLWVMTTPPRLVFYFFHHLRMPRLGLLGCMGLFSIFLWASTYGRTSLQVNREEFSSAKLPSSFDGFRIVQFSDAHLGSLVFPEREVMRWVDSINRLNADLVVFTGDMIHIRHTELTPTLQNILSKIQASEGVISITGNHDEGVYVKDTMRLPLAENRRLLIEKQRQMGWHVLDNTTLWLHRGGDSISVSGFSFDPELRKQRHDRNLPATHLTEVYHDIPTLHFNLTAVHTPQLWDAIMEAGYGDLTLAGHVHAMQLKINLFGFKLSPARLIYPRWSGRYDRQAKMLYINDGTGYAAFPMRLGAWPEINLITLRKCESSFQQP